MSRRISLPATALQKISSARPWRSISPPSATGSSLGRPAPTALAEMPVRPMCIAGKRPSIRELQAWISLPFRFHSGNGNPSKQRLTAATGPRRYPRSVSSASSN